MNEVADKNAECIRLEGQVESELQKVLQSRRQYEYMNKKLEVIKAIG